MRSYRRRTTRYSDRTMLLETGVRAHSKPIIINRTTWVRTIWALATTRVEIYRSMTIKRTRSHSSGTSRIQIVSFLAARKASSTSTSWAEKSPRFSLRWTMSRELVCGVFYKSSSCHRKLQTAASISTTSWRKVTSTRCRRMTRAARSCSSSTSRTGQGTIGRAFLQWTSLWWAASTP